MRLSKLNTSIFKRKKVALQSSVFKITQNHNHNHNHNHNRNRNHKRKQRKHEQRCNTLDIVECTQDRNNVTPTLTTKVSPLHSNMVTDLDDCPICKNSLMIDCIRGNILCKNCGFLQEIPDPGGVLQSTTYFNLEKKATLFTHARLKKLRTYMNIIFAKQKSVVPIQILVDICKHLTGSKEGTTLELIRENITFESVSDFLDKNIKFKKFRDYKTQIYCKIMGREPPRITPRQEEAIIVLFIAIQEPFDRLKKTIKTTFFSISYLFYVLCSFLGYTWILEFISMARTRTKIYNQKELLMKIFCDLNWYPFPEMPLDEPEEC